MKIRRSMTIDPDVWHRTQEVASRARVSASWLTEEILRDYLSRLKPEKGPKNRAPTLEAIIDRSA